MKAILGLAGIALILLGKIVIYRTSVAASKTTGGTMLERIHANPRWKTAYRFGHVQYVLGMVVFATAFFI